MRFWGKVFWLMAVVPVCAIGGENGAETTLSRVVNGHEKAKMEEENKPARFTNPVAADGRAHKAQITVAAPNGQKITSAKAVGRDPGKMEWGEFGNGPWTVDGTLTTNVAKEDGYLTDVNGTKDNGGGAGNGSNDNDNKWDFVARLDATPDIILEPICNDFAFGPKNPSGIVCGDRAEFVCSQPKRIGGSLLNNPMPEIEWYTNSKTIKIIEGRNEKTVLVEAKSAGDFELRVKIKGCSKENEPRISGKVFSKYKEIPLFITVVCSKDGTFPKNAQGDFIDKYIENANQIFRQAGIRFTPGRFSEKNGQKYDNFYFLEDKEDKYKEITEDNQRSLTSTFRDTGGFEIYFVKEIDGAIGCSISASRHTEQRGIIISEKANEITLAHELGHALGLEDIQKCPETDNINYPGTKIEWCPKDWSNGYYTKVNGYHSRLISRLLMKNDGLAYERLERCDIPCGKVFGNAAKGTNVGMKNVGLDSLKRENPDLH